MFFAAAKILNYFPAEYPAWLYYRQCWYLMWFWCPARCSTMSETFPLDPPAPCGSVFISRSTFSFIVTVPTPADGSQSGQLMPVLVWFSGAQTDRFLTLEVWLKCTQMCILNCWYCVFLYNWYLFVQNWSMNIVYC